MSEDNRGGPSNKGPAGKGAPNRDRRDGPGGKGGFNKGKGGKGGFGKGPAKAARAETYESLKEITRGEGFRIDKFQLAEKGTHKPVKTEYRLFREGLTGTHSFERLADAQAAATAPLPEPVVEEVAVEEVAVVEAETAEATEETPHSETDAVESSETPETSEPA